METGKEMTEMTTKYAAQYKYEQANQKKVTFKFHLKYDADILEKLNSVPNKLQYLKNLIRADIEREKNGEQ